MSSKDDTIADQNAVYFLTFTAKKIIKTIYLAQPVIFQEPKEWEISQQRFKKQVTNSEPQTPRYKRGGAKADKNCALLLFTVHISTINT